MITADSVKAKLQTLIQKANQTTGNSYVDLTTAVDALIDGYGQGSGSNEPLLLDLLNGTVQSIVFPDGTNAIRQYLLYGVTSLTHVDASTITKSIDTYAFANSGLTEIVMPQNLTSLTPIGGRAFQNCKSMIEFEYNGPGMITSGSPQIFAGCTALKYVKIPNMHASNASTTFNGCTSLEYVEISNNTKSTFNAQVFKDCSSLKTLVIRCSTAISTIGNINCFDGTPFASGGTGGTVYVPAALIPQYQQATNWSTIYAAGTCNFVAIEGSEYE